MGQVNTPAENSAFFSESGQLKEVPCTGEVIAKEG